MIIFLLGILIGSAITAGIWWFMKKRGAGRGLVGANAERERVQEEALAKVLELARAHAAITNDDVQKLLGVSDATATRYLQELESRGKIVQHGSDGHAVTYSLPSNK